MNTEMIFGAPGCGKTTYLLNLLDDVLEKYESDKVAFVSFTRKGSYEGRDRAIEKFNLKEKDLPYFRTIHSLAFRDLNITKYDMISKRNYKEFSKAMGMNFVGYYTEDFVNNDDQYLFFISLEKNNPGMANNLIHNLDYKKFTNVKSNYNRYKKELHVKDFDDLIVEFIKKDKPLPVEVAIIDEAQDLTSLQWKFCEVAFRNCDVIYIAGDDDQAIYEWSGADVHYFLNKTKTSNVTILDKSYRLKQNILDLSKQISNRIKNRVDKVFDSIAEGGQIYFYNKLEDISINSEESYYFLSRNNYFLPSYKKYLMKKGLIFTYKHKTSVDYGIYNAIKRYEHLRRDQPNKISKDITLKPYLKHTHGGFWYDVFDMRVDDSNYYRDIFKNKTDVHKTNLHVDTIHGVKGGEADNVVLKLDMTRTINNNMLVNQDCLDSELRCLYVALTRAKKNLHIIHSNSKFGYDELFKELL